MNARQRRKQRRDAKYQDWLLKTRANQLKTRIPKIRMEDVDAAIRVAYGEDTLRDLIFCRSPLYRIVRNTGHLGG